VHFRTLALDGVFVRSAAGRLEFHPARPPTDAEVGQVLGTIRRRVGRLLRRRGLEPGEDGGGRPEDPLAEASPALAGIVGASVQARVALGARAGAAVRRLGQAPRQASRGAGGPRHAHVGGFDLHANVWVGANNRARLEQLCRYVLRPPLAEDRLRLLADGRVPVALNRAWRDGTTHLLFEPVEFLEKLAALTPRPEIHLAVYSNFVGRHCLTHPGTEGRLVDPLPEAGPAADLGCLLVDPPGEAIEPRDNVRLPWRRPRRVRHRLPKCGLLTRPRFPAPLPATVR
jgi:Putative transposase